MPEIKEQLGSEEAFTLEQPPWKLEAEAWWFFLSLVGKFQERVEFKKQKIRESTGSSDTNLQGPKKDSFFPAKDSKNFLGGFGTVQLVRYYKSPIGPYDELLIVPGKFSLPKELSGSSSGLRIPTIYVSTPQSVYNGCHHWNIPKKLARFEFIENPALHGEFEVKIYHQFNSSNEILDKSIPQQIQFSDQPFFSARIRNRLRKIKIPLNLSKVPGPKLGICQPPLEENIVGNGAVENSTKQDNQSSDWIYFKPSIKGKVGICSFKENLKNKEEEKLRFANGENFPDFKPYQIGFHWSPCLINFPFKIAWHTEIL
ncbi:hypothetical protein BY996DRAFT_6435003 [Phakopsora pachyrhizi]|nr:hypothetical protein BY996DRAFT_6435003 [Phakopsora pachyrhizi]